MEERFLIYQGFEKDALRLFREIMERNNFQVILLTDFCFSLENKKVVIEIYYKGGIQIWFRFKTENSSVVLNQLAFKKGLLDDYLRIKTEDIPVSKKIEKISGFILHNFSNEISESGPLAGER